MKRQGRPPVFFEEQREQRVEGEIIPREGDYTTHMSRSLLIRYYITDDPDFMGIDKCCAVCYLSLIEHRSEF